MKHLQRKENIVPKEGSMLITESVTEKDTAIKAKMHQVEPTLFGKKLINYKCEEIRRVWVPYYFLVYDYHVTQNVYFNKSKIFNKTGRVAVVYDVNEMHAFHYDVADGNMPLINKKTDNAIGAIINDGGSFDEVCKDAEHSIQRNILWRAYKTEGKLSLIKTIKFYREAWEINLKYKDRTYVKYAYLDAYGVHDEKTRGLQTRLESI